MAPELWEGKEADKMADLYALGVMAYEMLTGEVPFTGDTPIAVGYKHVHGEVPRTGMGGMVDEVMRVAMAKERERRFQSGMALVMALEKALERRQEGQRRESFDEAVVERQNFAGVVQSGQSSHPTPTGAIAERKPITQREVNPKVAFFACAVVVLGVILAYWLSYKKPSTFPKHEEERFEHAYQEALQFAQKIEDAGARSWMLGDIAAAMAKAGQFDRALQIAQKIEDAGRRSEALKAIAEAMAKAGQFDRALQIAQKIEGASDRSLALAAIAAAMAEAGQLDRALEAAETIDDPIGRLQALAAIVAAKREAEKGKSEKGQK
jgi:tetratricopeptide (TPR) repeat protein